MNATTRECPACGGVSGETLFRQQFAMIEGVSILNGYDVVACMACGMTFADRIPSQADFDAYYRDASKYEFPQRDGAESPHDTARLAHIADTIARLVPVRDVRILDVGCATGRLLAELHARGFSSVKGIDPSPACVEAARRLFGVDASVGTISSAGGEGRSSDLIILVGVLEHLRDLQRLLGQLRGSLAAGGHLYIEVPDATGFGRWPNAPYQEFSVEHVNYFSPASMRAALASAGFACEWIEQNSREVSPGTTVPNLSVLARAVARAGESAAPGHDAESREAIARYVEQSARDEAPIRERITALVSSGDAVVVWGTGTQTLRLLAASDFAAANIVAFVDSNARYQGAMLVGRPILGPISLLGRPEDIVVASRAFAREIEAQITSELRLENRIRSLS